MLLNDSIMAAKMDVNKINEELYNLYQDYSDEIVRSWHVCIKCPIRYCDDDNERIMFIRFTKDLFYDTEEKYSFDCYSQMYADAIQNKYDQLKDSSMVDYMESINKNLNPNKSCNYICTYVNINLLEGNQSYIKLSERESYKKTIAILKKEIDILKPNFLFFVDLQNISTEKINYQAQFDLLKELFATDVYFNYNANYKDINSIIGKERLNSYCFRINSLDINNTNIVVNDLLQQDNAYIHSLSTLKTYMGDGETKRLENIKLTNFRSHTTNTDIPTDNNLLVLIGANDVGKTSVLQGLDMLFKKDIEIKGHITVKVGNSIFDYENIDTQRINYHWFKTETFFDDDIKDKNISELKDSKRVCYDTKISCMMFKKQMYEILDIFKYINEIYIFLDADIKYNGIQSDYSKNLKKIFDCFLKDRDLLTLTICKSVNYIENWSRIDFECDGISIYYSDDNSEFIMFKKNIEGLFEILKHFYLDFEKFDSVFCNGSESILDFLDAELQNSLDNLNGKNHSLTQSFLGLNVDDDNEKHSNYYAFLYEQQQFAKTQYFNGSSEIAVVDEFFLKNYGYAELLLNGSPKEIVDKTQEIKDNLNLYISRKLDNGIVDKWDELLKDFTSGDNVPIEKRGAGVRRLCSLFSYVVDAYRNKSVHQVPTIFAIDEVELSLHPNQQRKFIKVLMDLSKDFQFIITTHSPYVLSDLKSKNIQILKKNGNGEVVPNPMSERVIRVYDSISEINFIAFGETSIEYHIELFGYLHNKLVQEYRTNRSFRNRWNRQLKNDNSSDGRWVSSVSIRSVDTWLNKWLTSIGEYEEFDWYDTKEIEQQSPQNPQPEKRTLPYCVRNSIDHPLNGYCNPTYPNAATINTQYKNDIKLIEKSIKIMREAIKRNNL